MYARYRTYLERRMAPASVRIRMYWITRLATVTDPTTATTDELYDFIDSGNWSPSSRSTIVSSLHVFYRWATTHGERLDDPSADIPQPRVPQKTSRIATDDIILDAISIATTAERAMLLLGAECGLRVAEIAKLCRDDRDGEWLSVLGKGGVTRPLHMSPELVATLDEIERTTMRWGYYFPSARVRQPIAASTVWRHVRALTGLNTHALRHRAGTVTYRNGGYDLRLAQQFLGHASPTTTALYVHVEREELMRASAATRITPSGRAA